MSRALLNGALPVLLGLIALGTLFIACGDDRSAPDACVPGSVGCPCGDAGTCSGDLTCNIDAGVCEESSDCQVLGCGEGQRCGLPEGGLDRVCLPSCADGFTWIDRLGRCVENPPRCEDEGPGSVSAMCAAEHRVCVETREGPVCLGCEVGYLEAEGKCRPVKTCAELPCGELARTCVEATSHGDAECGSCQPGYLEVDGVCAREVCDPVPPAGAVRAHCADELRVCTEQNGTVTCGDCFKGYVLEEGQCRPARTCADRGCESRERLCTPAGDHEDAQCGGCRAGFIESGGDCVPVEGATCALSGTDSLLQACAAEHRTCEVTATGARCGGCADGYVWDESAAACVPRVLCSELDCAAQHRECDNFPNGHCTTCATGFTENPEDGTCRPVAGCEALKCEGETVCVEGASDTGDAACKPDCGPDSVWNGLRCEACPPCDAPGEKGRYPTPTRAGYCICETEPGYFYSTAGDVGTHKCDTDGDGWVRESARLSVESSDRVLAENARCTVRQIDRFVVVNEQGQALTVPLERPLSLFESDRNDDDALLQATFAARGLPTQLGGAAGARLPKAAELNRLTKFCHHLRADYNDNGAFDVVEWGDAPLSPVLTSSQQPFNRFSYFTELHQGYYVAPGQGEAFGHYRIVERKRPAAGGAPAPDAVPLRYPATAGDSWRTCERERDALFGNQDILPVGLDLAAEYTPPQDPHVIPQNAFRGMMHHSQFKCLTLSSDPDPLVPTARKPSELSDVVLNACSLSGDGAPLGAGPNAQDPRVACETVDVSDPRVAGGAVFWGAVTYRDHGPWGAPADQREYVRGCRNGCYAALSNCPGFNTNPASVMCTYDASDFGRFVSCDVAEICDGIDNDEDPGTIDGSGDPQVNQACVPEGQKGECLLGGGTYICTTSEPWLVCQPNVTPTAGELACDGRDEDCNGLVDDGDPGNDGSLCTPTPEEFEAAGLAPDQRFGECAKGRRGQCVDGRNRCEIVHMPQAEICGNGLDDDCDGEVDESEMLHADGTAILGKYGVSTQPGCTNYWRDKDSDNFGSNLEVLCLCLPSNAPTFHAVDAPNATLPGRYVYRTDQQSDCCDSSNEIYPGAGGWLSSVGPCGNYDKNCDGQSEREYKTVGSRACHGTGGDPCTSSDGQIVCCGLIPCKRPTQGWDNSVPECGFSGPYLNGDCGCEAAHCGGSSYSVTETRLQRCR